MSVLYEYAGDIYLTGAGATPCLRWHCDDDSWLSEPAKLPASASTITAEEVPDSLREELLAFVVRADAMGASTSQFGN